MRQRRPAFVIGVIVLQQLIVFAGTFGSSPNFQPPWVYYLEQFDTETSNNDLLPIDLYIDRIGPGNYAISGTIDVKYDITDNDYVEILTYRSASGNSDFKLLPYSIPKRTFVEYMNSFYKDAAMEDLSKCSNFPYFKDSEFKLPFEKKIYDMKKCQIRTDQMPESLPEGFYKVEFIATGTVNWKLITIVKLEQSMI